MLTIHKIKTISLSLLLIIIPIIYTIQTKEGDLLFLSFLGLIALLGAVSETEKDYYNMIYWVEAEKWTEKADLINLIQERKKCTEEEAERQYNYNLQIGNFCTFEEYKKRFKHI